MTTIRHHLRVQERRLGPFWHDYIDSFLRSPKLGGPFFILMLKQLNSLKEPYILESVPLLKPNSG